MTDIDREAIARIPRDLRKERGWSGARSVGIVKLIEERLKVALGLAPPPEPAIDPDLLEARRMTAVSILVTRANCSAGNGKWWGGAQDFHDAVLAGQCDQESCVQDRLAAIKRGRELAAEQA